MTDIRQSEQYAKFMNDLGWQIEKLDQNIIFLKKFLIVCFFAKIPKYQQLIDPNKLIKYKKQKRIFRLKLSPNLFINSNQYLNHRDKLIKSGFKIDQNPFNPTTTILIDLTQSQNTIFNNFSEAKRRGVRRAIKNNIIVNTSDNLESFINIRKKQYQPLGFLLINEMKKLWKNFFPYNASLLLAYPSSYKSIAQIPATASICVTDPVAGILLLFYDNVAYYWYASALPVGKKLFAPTLLVWEALKFSKKRGCKVFDFEGICDERFPEASQPWKGFTKFKEGFGGRKIVLSENFFI